MDVTGQIRSRVFNANSATSINWNSGNLQYTNAGNPGAGGTTNIAFTNMQDGGAYTLVVTATNSQTFTFSQAGLTFYFVPANGATTGGSRTVYTFVRAGNDVYVSWITGFQ